MGAEKPPPKPQNNCRSALSWRPRLGIMDGGEECMHIRIMGANIEPPSAPCPGAGSITTGSSHSVICSVKPNPEYPAPAMTAASYSPLSTLRSRVSTLPRIERTLRSGCAANNCACRRKLLVPTTAPIVIMSPASGFCVRTITSRIFAAQIAPIIKSAWLFYRRSLRECTAKSISPRRSASSSSAVNKPLPPISGKGRSRRLIT